MSPRELSFIDKTIAAVGRGADAVIPILQALQEEFGYLPEEALRRVCQSTDITPAAMTGVSTFYDLFRHKPAGKVLLRVCRGTACHVSGAERVEESVRRELKIPEGGDTDSERQFTVEPVACLGCCTLAPVIRIANATFGHLSAEKFPGVLKDFLEANGKPKKPLDFPAKQLDGGAEFEIHVGLGSCCMAKGSDQLFGALQESLRQCGIAARVKRVGCVGMCHRTPLVEVSRPSRPNAVYSGLNPALARDLVRSHSPPNRVLDRMARAWNRFADHFILEHQTEPKQFALDPDDPGVRAFLDKQIHLATEHFGQLDPLDLDEYVAHDGFAALRNNLGSGSPEQLIETIEHSGLRGRGGAGFPTGPKWRLARQQPAPDKFVICNGDEGDPGAFMDRMILESFPFRVIEGLALAAWAIGAHEGIFYIRHEYPLAVERVAQAIRAGEERGWLGERLLGSDFSLRLAIKEGAGAFVCGEETALMASIEGRRGLPRLRPPFPVEAGLEGKPTVINNVETLALVPWIVRHGAEAFAAHGTETSKGTKVFALAGKVRRGGLIEVAMGTTIREIVEEIGGGVAEGRKFKAVQIGGPSGGCVPAELADTPVDYESLRKVGAIMGSGGLVVLDDSDCMVDIARYFLQFTQNQSCGKCTFCRIGTRRMLEILDRLCAGKGKSEDLAELEELARWISQSSLCGLGKTAPNPVLTTLEYFRAEYEAHLQGKCPARKCRALVQYKVLDHCTGCTICAQHCPTHAIAFTPYRKHRIDPAACIHCDSCRQLCPHQAVELV